MFVKNCVLEGGVQQVETPPIERSFSLASPSRTDEARKHARGKLRFRVLRNGFKVKNNNILHFRYQKNFELRGLFKKITQLHYEAAGSQGFVLEDVIWAVQG
jgi:hypothetical protein